MNFVSQDLAWIKVGKETVNVYWYIQYIFLSDKVL